MWRLSARPSARASARARPSRTRAPALVQQLRVVDLNHRPRGYEPRELPGCSTPRQIPRSRARECLTYRRHRGLSTTAVGCDVELRKAKRTDLRTSVARTLLPARSL